MGRRHQLGSPGLCSRSLYPQTISLVLELNFWEPGQKRKTCLLDLVGKLKNSYLCELGFLVPSNPQYFTTWIGRDIILFRGLQGCEIPTRCFAGKLVVPDLSMASSLWTFLHLVRYRIIYSD